MNQLLLWQKLACLFFPLQLFFSSITAAPSIHLIRFACNCCSCPAVSFLCFGKKIEKKASSRVPQLTLQMGFQPTAGSFFYLTSFENKATLIQRTLTAGRKQFVWRVQKVTVLQLCRQKCMAVQPGSLQNLKTGKIWQ